MAKIIGVKFRNTGKVYYFDPGRYIIKEGAAVIVETVQGIEYADVVIGTREVPDTEIVAPLKGIVRVATQEDIRQAAMVREKEENAFRIGETKIAAHQLDMKLVRVEYAFDGSKIVFFFTSEGRVDFRELVKDLAQAFRTRIELRQIGARDETKLIGGLGMCGQPCCCNRFLNEFTPVSIKMAKEQGLSLNPTKISGLCGRLMCCLQYEQSTYEKLRKQLPKVGTQVRTPDGFGKVFEQCVLKESVKVKMLGTEEENDIRLFSFRDVAAVKEDEVLPEAPKPREKNAILLQAAGEQEPDAEKEKAPEHGRKRDRAPKEKQSEPGRQKAQEARPQGQKGQKQAQKNKDSKAAQAANGEEPKKEARKRPRRRRRGRGRSGQQGGAPQAQAPQAE